MNRGNLLLFLFIVVCCFGIAWPVVGQTSQQIELSGSRRLTMEQSIGMAQRQSIQSMVNENMFAAAYWSNRSYRASRLPSLNFSAGLGNVNRSRTPLQDADTGDIKYIDVFTLSNNASLFIRQNIPATGGTVQVESSLRRLDQFITSDNPLTWYSQPITLSYTQPLFGFNSFKWAKKIEPHIFERAKIQYLERMEDVTIFAAQYFWGVAMARLDYDMAVGNYDNNKQLYNIARERHKIGSLGRDELLQLELGMLNDSLAINSRYIEYTSQKNRLASFIGLREDVEFELEIDYLLPSLRLEFGGVLEKALTNSSFELNRKIALLEADRAIAQAKANRGIDVSFNARFGLSQNDSRITSAYSHFRNEEVAGFNLSVPILDWGMGRGRVKMAQSQAETIRYEQEQALIDYEQDLFVKVMAFNAQQTQCDVSRRANEIAIERFELSMESFSRGTLSVTELNTARSEKDNAQRAYLSSLNEYWNSYFTLRKLTLYDYLSGTDINAEFDKLIE